MQTSPVGSQWWGVAVVGADDVLEVDHVDAEPAALRPGLDDAAEAPPGAALAAHPAGGDGLVTGRLDGPEGLAAGRKAALELDRQARIDGLPGNRLGQRRDHLAKALDVHLRSLPTLAGKGTPGGPPPT